MPPMFHPGKTAVSKANPSQGKGSVPAEPDRAEADKTELVKTEVAKVV